MTRNKNIPLISVVLFSGFISSLTETVLNNALTTIMRELAVSQSTAQWLSTGYILIVGIMMPVAVYLLSNFTLRKLFPTSLAIFIFGTIIGSIAPNFTILLVGRIIQGIAVGIIMPLALNLLVLLFPPAKRGVAMGMAGIVIILGPAIGPTLSGLIVDNFPWHALFYFILPLVIIAYICALIFTKNVTTLSKTKLDVLSVVESTVGLGTLLYGFSRIGDVAKVDGTSLICLLIGLVFIILFVRRQLAIPEPLLEMRVFKARSFTLTTILSAIASIAMLGGELIVPLYLQRVRGVSALTSGLLLLPGALVNMLGNPLAGIWYDHYGIKRLAIFGFLLLDIATIPMAFFNQTTPLWWICLTYAARMGGISLVTMTLATSGVNALPKRLSIHGNTVATTIRQIASSLGTSLLVTSAAIITSNSHHASNVTRLQAGYQGSFWVAAIATLICLILSFSLINKTRQEFE